MMGSSLRLCFFSALGLTVCWGAYFLCPTYSEWVVRRDAAWYRQAFPARFTEDNQTTLRERERLWTVTELLTPEVRMALHSVLTLVRRHLQVAWGWTPFFFAFSAVSVLAGLFARERLYLGTTYASPAASYVAKRLVGAAVLAFVLWCLGPVSAPYWGFFPLTLAAMTGLVAYVANLPLRL